MHPGLARTPSGLCSSGEGALSAVVGPQQPGLFLAHSIRQYFLSLLYTERTHGSVLYLFSSHEIHNIKEVYSVNFLGELGKLLSP